MPDKKATAGFTGGTRLEKKCHMYRRDCSIVNVDFLPLRDILIQRAALLVRVVLSADPARVADLPQPTTLPRSNHREGGGCDASPLRARDPFKE